jgi:hypothetical protein
MQVTSGEGCLIQLDELAGCDTLAEQPLLFGLGTVAVDDRVRPRELADLVNPLSNSRCGRRPCRHRRESYHDRRSESHAAIEPAQYSRNIR